MKQSERIYWEEVREDERKDFELINEEEIKIGKKIEELNEFKQMQNERKYC